MRKISASDAKTRFGALLDQAQIEPVTIEKQGRPIAVIVSFQTYTEQQKASPSEADKKKALRFLGKWAKRPALADQQVSLEEDPRAQAIWDKYTAPREPVLRYKYPARCRVEERAASSGFGGHSEGCH